MEATVEHLPNRGIGTMTKIDLAEDRLESIENSNSPPNLQGLSIPDFRDKIAPISTSHQEGTMISGRKSSLLNRTGKDSQEAGRSPQVQIDQVRCLKLIRSP